MIRAIIMEKPLTGNNLERLDTLWIESLKTVRKRISETVFHLWIEPLFPVALRNGTLFIEAPNGFFCGWVRNHYEDLLLEAVRDINRDVRALSFSVREGALAADPGEAEPPAPACDPAPPAEKFAPREETRRKTGGEGARLNPAYSFENFIIGGCNRLAHAAALSVSQTPGTAYNPLFIYGPVGVGKTHLMQAIGSAASDGGRRLQAAYLSCEQFLNEFIVSLQSKNTSSFRNRFRELDLLLIDDIQFLEGKEETQQEFFHTFNSLYDDHKQVVLSSDRPPKEIKDVEKRLVSRFEWGLVVDISPPDFETRVAIIKSKAQGKSFLLPNEVAFCLAENLEGNVRVLEGALNKLIACARLYERKFVDVDFVREILGEIFNSRAKKNNISIPYIIDAVSKYYNVKISDLKGNRRCAPVILPRQVAVYLSRKLTGTSLPVIGEYFGGRNHTTILYACRKIEDKMSKDVSFRDEVERWQAKIKQELN